MLGRKLGRFEILDRLGAGGMGQVYLAEDSRLGRRVAIKVLPDELTDDPEALARFEREARAVASLSHPNILGIYDFDTAEGVAFAAMELLEGETLTERLRDGPLPPRKVIDYGSQIAHGLAAAHARGIVHRDLKPGNLFVSPDGQLKILDFGLAKSAASLPDTEAATEVAPAPDGGTEPGTVLGTVGYMSPEQVRGEAAGNRSDIFSLGAVLYEMATGRRAFGGDSAVETMNAILKEDPPSFTTEAAELPPALERLIHHCLEKSPEERFQSARDLAFALEGARESSGVASAAVESRPAIAAGSRRGRRVATTALLLTAGIALGIVAGRLTVEPPEPTPVNIRTLTFSGRDSQPDGSPDGRIVAFVSRRAGPPQIWLKQLGIGGEEPLTDGPDYLPRFSPDGTAVLFVRDEGDVSSLYRQALVGGQARKLIENVGEGEWSPDGERIAFVRAAGEDEGGTSVHLANADGSGDRELLRLDNAVLFGLTWSPDGRRLAMGRAMPTAYRQNALLLIDLGSGEIATVPGPTDLPYSAPDWISSDRLLYAHGDLDRRRRRCRRPPAQRRRLRRREPDHDPRR